MSKRKTLNVNAVFLAIFIGYFQIGFSQPASVNNGGVSTFNRSDIHHLNKIQIGERDKYRSYFQQNFKINSLPVDSFFTLNINQLPEPLKPSMRIYFGKKSDSDTNDYVLLATPCKTAATSNITTPNLTYVDGRNTGNVSPPDEKVLTWYSIVFTNNSSTYNVNYSQVKEDSVDRYINNFKGFMTKTGLTDNYPLCFVVSFANTNPSNDSLMRIQAVLTDNRRSTVAGTVLRKKVKPTVKFSSLDTQVARACCETPPETGNSKK